MSSDLVNTLILCVLLAAASGYGYYRTQKVQPVEIEQLENEERLLRQQAADVEQLLAEEAASASQADDALRRWNSRYKVLPDNLTSPQVVQYLNRLSREGFFSFDLALVGVDRQATHSRYTYRVTGQALFDALYEMIWNLENGRGLYRVGELKVSGAKTSVDNDVTEIPREVYVADFNMVVDVFFGGSQDMSAPDSLFTIPAEVLPDRYTATNPFYPLLLDALPPNTDDLIDVEADPLVSVVGEIAVFQRGEQLRSLREGDRVYLGRLTSVNAERARVVADLNKGGLRERVELDLLSGESYKQAIGRTQIETLGMLSPRSPMPLPAPGTPEARALGLYDATEFPDIYPATPGATPGADPAAPAVAPGMPDAGMPTVPPSPSAMTGS
ncbi:MAG: hypothetical protein AAFP18_02795 [Bacteroidota bacterium]